VLNPLDGRLLPRGELFSSGRWGGGFDCRGHMDFLVVVVTPVAAEATRSSDEGLAPLGAAEPASSSL
jgi:hypothetical protein